MTTHVPTTLNFKNIQGDIIVGLPKKWEEFVFFQITNPALFRKELHSLISLITTMAQVMDDRDCIDKHKKDPKSGYPEKLYPVSGANIAFSAKGLDNLGIKDDLGDAIFASGQKADAGNLGDVINADGAPAWDGTFLQVLHGVLLISGESKASVDERRKKIEDVLKGSIKVIDTLVGTVRPGQNAGHEHFGFQDGISQPGIKGFHSLHQGQLAVDAGVIVCGGDSDPVKRSPIAKDGSFLAFRKLKQYVPEFSDFLTKNGTGFDGLNAEEGAAFLGARLVGRWKSGAPIDLAPLKDDKALADDPEKNNDFNYSFINPDDQTDQTRCPFSAHVRKTFPRNDLDKNTPPGGPRPSDGRRIMRQGIPYGPEVSPAEAHNATTTQQRGLAFVSYQTDLSKGFHFIQRSWANNPSFKQPGVGFDPIIGANAADPKRSRQIFGVDPKNQAGNVVMVKDFVESRGGEYFFSPSIATLRDVLATH